MGFDSMIVGVPSVDVWGEIVIGSLVFPAVICSIVVIELAFPSITSKEGLFCSALSSKLDFCGFSYIFICINSW